MRMRMRSRSIEQAETLAELKIIFADHTAVWGGKAEEIIARPTSGGAEHTAEHQHDTCKPGKCEIVS